MKAQSRYFVLSAVFLLSACGGGGGNAGTCSGSAEVCGTAVEPVAASSPSFTGVLDSQIRSTKCLEILAANSGDEARALLAAQDAYNRGATQLDGDPKDGIACNGVFKK